jgi:hypothetical protein
MRFIYLINWKESLPIDEVQLPHQLEGIPSGMRKLYLIDWKEGNEVAVPH